MSNPELNHLRHDIQYASENRSPESQVEALFTQFEARLKEPREVITTIGDYPIYPVGSESSEIDPFMARMYEERGLPLPQTMWISNPYRTEVANAMGQFVAEQLGYASNTELRKAEFKGEEEKAAKKLELFSKLCRKYAYGPTGIAQEWIVEYPISGDVISSLERHHQAKYGTVNLGQPNEDDPESLMSLEELLEHRKRILELAGEDVIKNAGLWGWIKPYANLRGRSILPDVSDDQIYIPEIAREIIGIYSTSEHDLYDNLALTVALGAHNDNPYGPSTLLFLPELRERFPDNFGTILDIYIERLDASADMALRQRADQLKSLRSEK